MLRHSLIRLLVPLILTILIAFSIVPLFQAQVDISSPPANQQDIESGTGCADRFCIIAWKRNKAGFSSVSARVLDSSGNPVGSETEIAAQTLTVGTDKLVVRGGGDKVLVAYSDFARNKLGGVLIDSTGQKTQIEVPANLKLSDAQIAATYDPSLGSFLIAYSSYINSTQGNDIYGYFVDGVSGTKLADEFPVVQSADVEVRPFAVHDRNLGKFIIVYSTLGPNDIKGFSTGYAVGARTLNPGVGQRLFSFGQYTTFGGDIIHNNVNSDYVLVTSDGTWNIYTYGFTLNSTGGIVQQRNTLRTFTESPSLSFSPMSFDPVNNNYLLAFSRYNATSGAIKGYIQIVDTASLDNVGPEKFLAALTAIASTPSISYGGSLSNSLVAYSSSNKMQSIVVDANGDTISSRTYTHPTDQATSQYTLIDTSYNVIPNGFKGLTDTLVIFNHSAYGSRLIGALEFSKANPDLSSLKIEATATATAIDKAGVTGFSNETIIIVPDDKNNSGVRVCPQAKKVSEIVPNCAGELLFRGPFPEARGEATAIQGTLDSKDIYGVSGLKGSGIALISGGAPVPVQNKTQAQLSLSISPLTADNKTIEVRASYTSNSTPITGASCSASYTDQLLQQHQMAFNSNSYKHNRTFQTPPTNVNADVTCSHANYTQEKATISLATGQQTTQTPSQTLSVTLTSPKATQTTNSITFTCSATGSDLKELSLYTNAAGNWKKEETKPITQSTLTQQFKIDNVANGSYAWNCEAKTNAGNSAFAPQNQSFEVSFSAASQACQESTDCNAWTPDPCPQTQTQTRTCNNAATCGYPVVRPCVFTGIANASASPTPTTTSKPTGKGLGLTEIVLIIVIIIAVIGAILFVLKRRQSGGEESLYEETSEESGEPETQG